MIVIIKYYLTIDSALLCCVKCYGLLLQSLQVTTMPHDNTDIYRATPSAFLRDSRGIGPTSYRSNFIKIGVAVQEL